jgi:hypothetical protein
MNLLLSIVLLCNVYIICISKNFQNETDMDFILAKAPSKASTA